MEKTRIVDRPNPDKEFLLNRHRALVHVNNNFKKFAGLVKNEHEDFRWIKTELTSPRFEDFAFAYRNKIFCIIVEKAVKVQGNQMGFGNRQKIETLLDACEENNLTPCIFPIVEKDNRPVYFGTWNLINPTTGKFVDPINESSDELVEVSDWELKNWAVQIVINYVREQGLEILSYCDAPGVDPQIWFKNDKGRPCWIEVLPAKFPEKNKVCSVDSFPARVLTFDGYVAHVNFAGDEDHTNGNIYRSKGADIAFNGIKKVN